VQDVCAHLCDLSEYAVSSEFAVKFENLLLK
jgi:hypothetical protein